VAGVVLSNIRKSWANFTAIDNLNLEVMDGEFLVLLGASGCGKTTTMRIIAGLEAVTNGDVLIDGQRANELLPGHRDIAMVFQNYGLYPHMSVAENIAYPLRLRRIAEPERSALVAQAADKVHLGHLLDRKPRALSGGQRQRVALARALVRTPRLFLMDEPLSNLDAKLRVSMRAELKRLHHDLGITTVYVTHDQIEAMTLATRVAVMNSGRIVQLASPEVIYGDPNSLFVASFIGSPPMNLIEGNASDGTFRTDGASVGAVPAALSGRVVLGIRPAHLSLIEPAAADMAGPVHSVEYTGDGVLVNVKVGDALVCVATDAGRKPAFDERVGLRLDRDRWFFFDAASQDRIRI
jgi:multiple sugar transport system ATP-binding protein